MMQMEKRLKLAGLIAGIAAIVWALPHFWFWSGISLAFPGEFPAGPRGDIYWIVGGFGVLMGLYAIGLTHLKWVRRLPEPIVAFPAWTGAVGLTVWGAAFFNLMVQIALGAAQPNELQDHPNAVWGYYWYSLFILWGVSLGFSAFYFHKVRKKQKQLKVDGAAEPEEAAA